MLPTHEEHGEECHCGAIVPVRLRVAGSWGRLATVGRCPDPSVAVMWFRRDLRLSDNPALVEACSAHDEVLPLFVHDDRLRGPSGAPRLAFLCRAASPRSTNRSTDVSCVGRATRRPWCATSPESSRRRRSTAPRTSVRTGPREMTRWSRRWPPTSESSAGSGRPTPSRPARCSPVRARRSRSSRRSRGPGETMGGTSRSVGRSRPTWATGVRSDGMPKAPASTPVCPSRVSAPRGHGRTRSSPARSSTTPSDATIPVPTARRDCRRT